MNTNVTIALGLMQNSSTCSSPSRYGSEGAWIAWWDDNSEGKWVSAINSSDLLENKPFQPWAPGEPNGETIENCAVLRRSGTYAWFFLNKTKSTFSLQGCTKYGQS